MKKLLSSIISAGLGLWLATLFVAGVKVEPYMDSTFFGMPVTATWQLFILFAIVLGLLNFFLKPIINIITLPLRIITLGLFSIVINMAFVWILDGMFTELQVPLLFPLLWTTLIIWGINLVLSNTLLRSKD